MINSRKNLIAELRSLIETMELTHQKNLNMVSWVGDNFPKMTGITEPECGYVACIIGDHIIRTNKFATRGNHNIDILSSNYSHDLDVLCRRCLGYSYLTESIYTAEFHLRKLCSLESGLFTKTELKDFEHLTTDTPTPKDVILYINACIDKLKL